MSCSGPSLFLLSSLWALLEPGSLFRVSQTTLPVCHVVNGSLDCPVPCWGSMWEVTLLMMGPNGTKVHPDISVISDTPINVTSQTIFNDAPAEYGENAFIIIHRSSCCKHKVNIFVADKKGLKARCDFSIQWPSTTVTPGATGHQELSPHSSSLRTATSLCTILLLLATVALFL